MPNDRTQVIVPKNILPTSFLPKPPTVHSGHSLLRDVSKTHLVILTYDPERSNTGSDRYTSILCSILSYNLSKNSLSIVSHAACNALSSRCLACSELLLSLAISGNISKTLF